jgi:hypothetical protein
MNLCVQRLLIHRVIKQAYWQKVYTATFRNLLPCGQVLNLMSVMFYVSSRCLIQTETCQNSHMNNIFDNYFSVHLMVIFLSIADFSNSLPNEGCRPSYFDGSEISCFELQSFPTSWYFL